MRVGVMYTPNKIYYRDKGLMINSDDDARRPRYSAYATMRYIGKKIPKERVETCPDGIVFNETMCLFRAPFRLGTDVDCGNSSY